MKNSNYKFFTITLIASLLSLNSCKKQDVVSDVVDPVVLNNQLQFSDQSYIEAQTIAISAIGGNGFTLKNEAENAALGCANISRDYLGARNSIIIDFGAGCVANNGKTYAGRILAYYDGNMSQTGNAANITFDGFSINGISVGGDIEFSNTGINTNGNLTGKIRVNSNITFEGNAGSLSGAYRYSIERIENVVGVSADDEFFATGYGTGITSDGFSFNTLITTPLLWKAGCRYFVNGVNKTSISGTPDQLLDYGNGNCDNEATLTIDGNSQTIVLE